MTGISSFNAAPYNTFRYNEGHVAPVEPEAPVVSTGIGAGIIQPLPSPLPLDPIRVRGRTELVLIAKGRASVVGDPEDELLLLLDGTLI